MIITYNCLGENVHCCPIHSATGQMFCAFTLFFQLLKEIYSINAWLYFIEICAFVLIDELVPSKAVKDHFPTPFQLI